MVAPELREIARELRLLGEKGIADKVLCALAAATDAEMPRADLSYTYVMRELRNKNSDDIRAFQKTFKESFEQALDEGIDEPEQVALMEALQEVEFEDVDAG